MYLPGHPITTAWEHIDCGSQQESQWIAFRNKVTTLENIVCLYV